MIWTVYILKCIDGKYYVGCTSNLSKRFQAHNKGHVSYTRRRRPVAILVSIDFKNKLRAFRFEKYLKSGSGIAFRQRHFQQ